MERSSAGVTADGGKGTVLVNTPTLRLWQLVQTTTVAIACTTGVYALLFSRLSGREGTRGKIGVARIECANTQRQKHCQKEGDDGKRPLAAFHGSTPFRSKKDDVLGTALCLLKYSLCTRVQRAATLPLNQ